MATKKSPAKATKNSANTQDQDKQKVLKAVTTEKQKRGAIATASGVDATKTSAILKQLVDEKKISSAGERGERAYYKTAKQAAA